MKLLFLFLCSFSAASTFAASCCVSNTSISNLMLQDSRWQETLTVAQSRVIGDVNEKGRSTFRRAGNKDITTNGKLDLSYGWNSRYQSGVSLKFQSRTRENGNTSDTDSGWNDVGLSHAYRIMPLQKIWVFQTLNIPTATSVYNTNSSQAVDARGTGTYLSSLGLFSVQTFPEWDVILSGEVHRSFARTFRNNGSTTEVGSFWGTSATIGAGYVPWRSKARYGVALTPRLEGAKSVTIDGSGNPGKQSLVWDSSVNISYTLTAHYALGLNYTDQTLFGPARNTLLNRTLSFQFQTRWF